SDLLGRVDDAILDFILEPRMLHSKGKSEVYAFFAEGFLFADLVYEFDLFLRVEKDDPSFDSRGVYIRALQFCYCSKACVDDGNELSSARRLYVQVRDG